MKITFGKHEGKTVEELFLKHPDYIVWCLRQESSGPMRALQAYARKLIVKFDGKPILKTCHGQSCEKPATRASVYLDNLQPFWWCDTCDPYEAGANNGKLQIIRKFSDAIQHVDLYCGGKKADQILAIKYLARGKGMPDTITTNARAAFFA